jgi:hypothetical protein
MIGDDNKKEKKKKKKLWDHEYPSLQVRRDQEVGEEGEGTYRGRAGGE